MPAVPITYDVVVSFTNMLLELRKAHPFSWQVGSGVTLRVTPHRELLSARAERLRFAEDLDLQTVRIDVEVSDGGVAGKTTLYLAAGEWWSQGDRAQFSNGITHYLLIHDRFRRSAQQINLLTSLVRRAGQMRLQVLPRFPKGGAEFSDRLRQWMREHAPVTLRGKQIDLGSSADPQQLLQNLLLLGLAKQHLRGLARFHAWMDTLPPAVKGPLVTGEDVAAGRFMDEELDEGPEEAAEDWVGLRLFDPPQARHSRRGKGDFEGKVNFPELNALAERIGKAGELLVLEAERAKLVEHGRSDLAKKVQRVAEVNDGAGYDILSFTPAGKRIYIEVKTTTGGANTGFFLTANELAFAWKHKQSYQLYRLYSYTENPERVAAFVLEGDLSEQVELEPSEYRVRVKGRKGRRGARG